MAEGGQVTAPAAQTQTPCVFVKYISVKGFKSFKLKAKIGPLSHFSCIVGPNGAGKSVIGEALAFVLGGSAKTMRANCLSSLLNEDLRNCGGKLFAKVSVTLEVSESHQVKVSRTITGSTSSYIWSSNGMKRPVSFGDMRQELLHFGVATDISERFIVMQSRQAVKAKEPLDLCEYLEVIFGVGHLKGMIMETEKEICDKSNGAILLQENLNDVQSKLEKLRPEVEKWQGFDHQWHDFQSRKVSYLHSQENALKCKLQQNAVERDKKLAAYHDVVERKNALQSLQRQINTEICTQKALLQQRTRALAALEKKISDLRTRMVKAQVRLDLAKRDAESNRQEHSKMQQKQDNLRKEVTALSLKVNEMKDRSWKLSQHREVLKEEKPKMILQQTLSGTNGPREGIEEIFDRISTSQEALAVIESELGGRKVEFANLTSEVQLMEKNYIETMEARKKQESKELAVQEALHATLQELEKVSSLVLPPLKETLKQNEFEIYNLKRKLVRFEKRAHKNSREDNAVEFLKAKLKGKFFGRVIDLAIIKGSMTVAVNSVISHLMNTSKTFVTEDRKTANEVILYFQEHKIGVVTCEILSELARLYKHGDNAPKRCAQGKPVMEYIDCDNMYKAVFWKYMRNWYIVDDRNAALGFLNGGKDTSSHENIVTVKGDIFKQDGEVISATMHASGDYLLRSCYEDDRDGRRGAISPTEINECKERVTYMSERQSVLKEEIIDHEVKAAALQTQVGELQTQLRNLQGGTHADTLSSLGSWLAEKRRLLTNLRCKIQNLEMEASQMRNSIIELQDLQDRTISPEMAAWRKKIETLDAEIKNCDLEIQKKSSGMKSKMSKLNGIDFIATELQGKDAQPAEAEEFYAQAKSQVDAERLQRDTLSSEADNLSQSLVSSSQLAEKYKKKIGALHKKETELKTQLEKLSESDLDLKEKIDKILKALPECSKDLPLKRMLHDFTDFIDANHLRGDEEDVEGVVLAEEELSLKNLHKTINPCTLDEDLSYRKEELQIAEKLEDIGKALDTLKRKKETFENERYNVFMKSVKDVNDTLSRVYGSFTKHGDAYLSFTEEKTLLFTEGVNFQVRPGRHKWCSFSILSGGQQALAALALSFSLQHQFPSPFYFFDEIDAALDTKNTQLVASYVMKQRCTQYIIVSHRPQLYEEASTIAGIYHSCGSSRSITAQT
ncbi:hypothetical protein GOP47_0016917 [Adiantum capillus-veneris]|uniref:Structural maintenance of chromosomes protein n=1 Tax=Adiantum capillus-veneris TaxID=13818 RepID=A0A9D4ZC56_ADICA|nr:hypothetical protein GOP47_0016917 [Adiantum capillus-veneris]